MTTLTVLTLVAAAAAAIGTIWWPGVLSGPPAMNGSARGTAIVVLAGAVPLVTLTTFVVRGSSISTMAVRTGGVAYLVYNGVLFLLGTPFNRLFLVYVAMVGLSGWTFGHLIRRLLTAGSAVTSRSRPVALYIGAIVVANTLLWLRGIIPALLSDRPTVATDGMGVATNPVWTQDLAFWLPASFVVAIALWRGRTWSVPMGIALLAYWFLEAVSVGVDQWMGATADPGSRVVSMSVVPGFFILALLTLVPLGVLLWLLRGPAEARSGWH
jgi:hypothetical protein